ncbi:MAG: hypothetical protein HKUEN07_26790 [Rhodocyclaceae bacterium]|nr:MAG: hypothetical protein HKUEN07_26790 [Rhodocyclaceae bacterium]
MPRQAVCIRPAQVGTEQLGAEACLDAADVARLQLVDQGEEEVLDEEQRHHAEQGHQDETLAAAGTGGLEQELRRGVRHRLRRIVEQAHDRKHRADADRLRQRGEQGKNEQADAVAALPGCQHRKHDSQHEPICRILPPDP